MDWGHDLESGTPYSLAAATRATLLILSTFFCTEWEGANGDGQAAIFRGVSVHTEGSDR